MRPPARLPREVERNYRAFSADALVVTLGEPLALVGSYLYAWPEGLPDLTGLRFIHPSWWLGVVKKERFEPSHALALGLQLREARRVLDLPAHDRQVAAYLRGEMLSSPGPDGWVLVGVDGYPLGWGKRARGRLRSQYPKGLRWK